MKKSGNLALIFAFRVIVTHPLVVVLKYPYKIARE